MSKKTSLGGFVVMEFKLPMTESVMRHGAPRVWLFASDVDAAAFGRQMQRRFGESYYVVRRANVAEVER